MKNIFYVSLIAVSLGVVGLIKSNTIIGAESAETPSAVATVFPTVISGWKINRTGATGYNNIQANVQRVRYSANFVYPSMTGIPTYSIGPWPGNPNSASNQNFTLKIPRNPVVKTGTKTSTPLGPIGTWLDGVSFFNILDGMSYQNQNIWHQNAVIAEAVSFDSCLGHPPMRGTYHPHQNPVCEYTANSSTHSPLLGYAFDGFPIYGPYGYANTNGTGGIRRITSSYRTRNITQRRTLPDGTVLQASQYGPDASTANPLGKYGEDFEYVSGLGDLDEYNGRISVTPEYPNGIYAYFVTITDTGASAYPYLIGAQYYGVVAAENITQQGQVTITEPVTTYVPSSITADFDGDTRTDFSVFRPTDRTWYVNRSSDGGYSYSQFGFADDPLVPSDFDGDGKADIAVFRPSTGDWWIKKSNDGTIAVQNWGLAGDFPVPADYDGDGKADVAIFRPSTGNWWIRNSGDSSVVARQWGISEDKPVVGDYDGDGKADIAVFRPSSGNWYFVRSSDGSFNSLNWGLSTDKLVQADYDGDGKTDVAVFRPTEGLWYVLKSSNGGFTVTEWGVASDQPAPGDFDGDGKADLTIFRPSTGSWWVKRSASTNLVVQFGSSGDLAVSGASVR